MINSEHTYSAGSNDISIRKLEEHDALLMHEWMHDNSIVKDLKTNFLSKSVEDCTMFIKQSADDEHNKHFAITDTSNEYLGTCSLKNINDVLHCAEFGIVIRKKAMGRGIAIKAMNDLFIYGRNYIGLKQVYWCVAKSNKRALRFYDKNRYERYDIVSDNILMLEAIRGGGAKRKFRVLYGIGSQWFRRKVSTASVWFRTNCGWCCA